jgi:hypothetical protein
MKSSAIFNIRETIAEPKPIRPKALPLLRPTIGPIKPRSSHRDLEAARADDEIFSILTLPPINASKRSVKGSSSSFKS